MKRINGVFARRQVEPGFPRLVESHSWDVAYTTDHFWGSIAVLLVHNAFVFRFE